MTLRAALARVSVAVLVYTALIHGRVLAVDGYSMEPTLRPHSLIWTVPIAFPWPPVRRGEVVVAEVPWSSGVSVVKRVAGVAGDCLVPDARRGAVLADGAERPCWPVDSHRLFLLGDNPAQSSDSRQRGQVRRDSVRRRVLLVLWPLSAVGVVR